jgi:hypothetical protein
MEAIDHLHRLRGPPMNAVRIEVAAIMTDDGDRRILDEPAIRQEVDDAMRHEIDQDGAIAMAPPPGSLVHRKGLGGWSGEDRRCPYQTQEGGRTG